MKLIARSHQTKHITDRKYNVRLIKSCWDFLWLLEIEVQQTSKNETVEKVFLKFHLEVIKTNSYELKSLNRFNCTSWRIIWDNHYYVYAVQQHIFNERERAVSQPMKAVSIQQKSLTESFAFFRRCAFFLLCFLSIGHVNNVIDRKGYKRHPDKSL